MLAKAHCLSCTKHDVSVLQCLQKHIVLFVPKHNVAVLQKLNVIALRRHKVVFLQTQHVSFIMLACVWILFGLWLDHARMIVGVCGVCSEYVRIVLETCLEHFEIILGPLPVHARIMFR